MLEASVGGLAPRASIADTMGMHQAIVSKGSFTVHARADHRHLNPLGGVHGGFAATLLDSVTGSAVHSMLEPGEHYATVDLAVKMLRPIPQGEEVIAEGKVVHMSRSLGVSEGRLVSASGKLLATGNATCAIRRQG
ncbi:MAG: PaaI family thioesterase [Erythrobacter sp.]|nr:PaaI family thioesterase [Erythrobacter sp.]